MRRRFEINEPSGPAASALALVACLTGCHILFPREDGSSAVADGPPTSDGPHQCLDDLDADPQNCGACGHDCGAGATCMAAQCQPQVMAGNQVGTRHLAVSDAFVWWNLPLGSLGRASTDPATNGTAELFMTGMPGANSLAVDTTHIYFTHDGGVSRCPLAGGCEIDLVEPVMSCSNSVDDEVAVTDDHVLATCSAQSSVHVRGKAAGQMSTVDNRTPLGPIVGSSSTVFWAEQDRINTAAIAGGNIGEIPALGVDRLALSGDDLFWISPSTSQIKRATTGPQMNIRTFVVDQPGLTALAVQDDVLYWVGGGVAPNGYLKACSINSPCTDPITLASGLDAPIAIAVDANFYYFVDGAVARNINRLRRAP